MSLEAKIITLLSTILFLVLACGVSYQYGKMVGKKIVISDDTKALNIAMKANDKLKNELEVDHENSVTAINTIMSVKPPIVRLPSCSIQTNPTGRGIQTQPSSGVLLGEAERILADDRQATWRIIGEAETELADCRMVKQWAVK